MKIQEHIWGTLDIAKHFNQTIYRKQILDKINRAEPELNLTDDQLRQIVREMVEQGYPIGTDPVNGYYIIDTQERFDRATESLRLKIIGLATRIKNLKRAIKDRFDVNVQLHFDFENIMKGDNN